MMTIYVVMVNGTLLLNTASFTSEIAKMKWEESSYYDPSLEVSIVTFKYVASTQTMSKEYNNEVRSPGRG